MKTQIERARILQNRIWGRAAERLLAFTLIEMLVVISIIGILAALIIPTARLATEKKALSTVEAELHQLEVPIDAYKDKLGYFPPDNTNNPAQPPLYYELGGTIAEGNPPVYRTLSGHDLINRATIQSHFGMASFMNSAATMDDVKNFHTQIKAKQKDTNSSGVVFFVVPAKGPPTKDRKNNDPTQPKSPTKTVSANPVELNTWRYDSSSANRHNLEGYDLWAEILIGGKTNIIGNWKR